MKKRKILIEVIHDIVCSWCPIGYRNLTAALQIVGDEFAAEIKFLPFELNPNLAPSGEAINTHLKRRNGWTTAQLVRNRTNLTATAEKAGLSYDFSKRTHYYNTAKAHTLLHWSEGFGKQRDVNEALVQIYFTEGRNIDRCDVLAQIAASVGLDPAAARAALGSEQVSHALQLKKERVRAMNIGSVPAFLVDGVDMLHGSNSVEYFVQYLRSSSASVEGNEKLEFAS